MKFMKAALAALTLFTTFGTAVIGSAVINSAQAAPLLGLYNTGVDANGNVLVDGSVDPHYQLYTPAFSVGNYLSGYSFGSFVGGNAYVPTNFDWGLDTATRAVISFGTNAWGNFNAYTYRTTFDLTGYNPADVTINYKMYTDDRGKIAVNGVLVGSELVYQPLTAGSLSGNFFTAGINTLDFVTFNEGGPGGFLFEVTSIVINNVPSVGSLLLLGSGLFLLVVIGQRRRDTRTGVIAA